MKTRRKGMPFLLCMCMVAVIGGGADECELGVQEEQLCGNEIDDDGDGEVDCADSDCAGELECIEAEICTDGADNDEDGLVDCEDDECFGVHECLETDAEICNDRIDNDGDGRIDCLDASCAAHEACIELQPEICDDRVDNDGDDLVDCLDDDCNWHEACLVPSPEACDDGVDNDLDGATDCADTDCEGQEACEGCGDYEVCSNGADDDCDGLVDCDDPECVRECPTGAEDCSNGIDDDGDGWVDCSDHDDCVYAPGCEVVPCDLLEQNCPESLRCWGYGPSRTDGRCYAIGGRGLGEECEEPPVSGEMACGRGLMCMALRVEEHEWGFDVLESGCLAYCGSSSDCPPLQGCIGLYDPDQPEVTPSVGVCVTLEVCGDGVDNDYDELPDCMDPDCDDDPSCEENCTDGIDNDGDGNRDCADSACESDVHCQTCDPRSPDCPDGFNCVWMNSSWGRCTEAGSRIEGYSCSRFEDCAAGLQCAAISGWNGATGRPYISVDESYLSRGGFCGVPCANDEDCAADEMCGWLYVYGVVEEGSGVCADPLF